MGSIHRVRKGLKLPINGEPKQDSIEKSRTPRQVALVGSDYMGMKPTMLVKEGDMVKAGQPVFECKRNPGCIYTAPAAGKVALVNRGKRRVFQSLVIDVTGNDQVSFKNYKGVDAERLDEQSVRDLLLESGQWTAIRQRPFGKVAMLDSKCRALFITAMDSHPLAPNPVHRIKEAQADFENGVKVLSHLTSGPTYVCKEAGADISVPSFNRVQVEEFKGVHPAGTAGLHINYLMKAPVSLENVVWHVGYQDVITIGKLFKTGKLDLERVISIGGPKAKNPRLIRTQMGARLSDILGDEVVGENSRVVSGSVFAGQKADGPFDFLGRFANQVTILEEGTYREFLGWKMPGFNKFSIKNTFAAKLIPGKTFDFSTDTNGSPRAMVPVGMYEKVMPFRDVLPTQLLRAIFTKDMDGALELGVLEFVEEDLALCTFASPGKEDFSALLRENLEMIEKEM